MKTSNKTLRIYAAVTDWSDIAADELEAREATSSRLRRFSMVAYTGRAMDLPGWAYPVVIDLSGLKMTEK